jgi:hypothetical protein
MWQEEVTLVDFCNLPTVVEAITKNERPFNKRLKKSAFQSFVSWFKLLTFKRKNKIKIVNCDIPISINKTIVTDCSLPTLADESAVMSKKEADKIRKERGKMFILAGKALVAGDKRECDRLLNKARKLSIKLLSDIQLISINY